MSLAPLLITLQNLMTAEPSPRHAPHGADHEVHGHTPHGGLDEVLNAVHGHA